MLDVRILTLLCFFTTLVDLYYITTSTTTLNDTDLPCKLATPELVYSQQGRRVLLNVTLPEDGVQFQNGSLYRVGYAESYQAFLYIGCSSATDVANINYSDEMMSPGQCHSACKTSYFGIQNSSCYCYSNENNIRERFNQSCTLTCSRIDGVLCGGDHAVSIYKKVIYRHGVTNRLNFENDCLLLEKKSDGRDFYSWAACDTTTHHTCNNDIHEFLFSNFSGDWSSSVQKCLDYGYNPANESYDAVTANLTIYGSFWTGTIRSHSVFYTDDLVKQNVSASEILQGYIKSIAGIAQLSFEPIASALPSFCEGETSVSTSSSILHPTTVPISTDDESTTVKSTIHKTMSTIDIVSSRGVDQTESTDNIQLLTSSVHPKGLKEDSDLIVGISIGVALLLLVVIASAVYVIWRKRRNTGIENLQEAETQAKQKYIGIELNERTRGSKYSANGIISQYVMSSEYDTTPGVTVVHNKEPTQNMNETDDMYDHTDRAKHGTTLRKTEDVEKTYDHLEQDDPEGVYNTATYITGPKPIMTASGGTYAHIPVREKILSDTQSDITVEEITCIPEISHDNMDVVYTKPIPRDLRTTVDK